MVETRAQRAAKRRHKPEPEDPAEEADPNNPVGFWIKTDRWPSKLFEPEPDMEHLLARRKSSSSSARKRSSSASSITPSDQKPREEKSAQYRDSRYETLLATKGSFMAPSKLDITNESKILCETLLEGNQTYPENSLFRDDIFGLTCEKIRTKNEARVLQDITRLIVPSAESLATYGAEHLDILTESVNEGWNNSIPLTGRRPQPDYSVGFLRDAFTEEQLDKLSPFIGDFLADQSYFMATYYMYFPFLACEVKCGDALDVADRQNAHTMTLAARGVVELFRLVGRENDVHRQIVAFSISHDQRSVRIYGYYPVIDGKNTKYYRHEIYTFSFTTLNGRDKWTAYRFTKNIYDTWMPGFFKRICSAIDQLPAKVDFEVQALSESTGLSQRLENGAQMEDSVSLSVEENDQADNAGQVVTPATSFLKLGPVKRRKKT
ncbi:hypothetical protein BBK36DRAFT_1177550 [Trichoderma citrinoviride]|uniref:DUF7924 domain-containing protein n=1 Tax=Trichoderma citrinoviride TaxID=58853 RepID=A0A2T4B669_9HYPO|nr:hypothetical protein BBK36DRAFT_1177550 [Trichoderma citrinoviride]PTB64822.1 hypothetical protein BBK36DRAFT_1177550 [Trichoderma citrinoviride]